MGILLAPVIAFFTIILKLLWWCGIYWLVIWLMPTTLYTVVGNSYAAKHGTFFGQVPNSMGNVLPPTWIENTGFYISLVFMALTIIQNIYRLFSQDPTFNIFKAVFGFIFDKIDDGIENFKFRRMISPKNSQKYGFVAKIKPDTAKNISGFVFGKLNGKYVTKKETEDGHMLIIGGAGSGKSSCVAIPTLMSWQGRVFAIDVKGELYKTTSNSRDKKYIKVFNPSDRNANGYDPLYVLKHCDDVTEGVKEIAQAIIPLPADIKDPFWVTGAQNVLAGAILYYSENQGMNFSEIMRAVQSQPIKAVVDEIMESDNLEAKLFISNYAALRDETLGGIASEISGKILPFAANEALRQALDGHGECITPNDLEKGYDIYVCIEESKLEQWRGLLTMMCNQFLKEFERRQESNNKPILFMLDEFPRLGKIEAIINGLATLRSKKIQIALFVQSKSQLNAIYGKDVAEIIADNCQYKAILKASEPATQEWCSKLVGTSDKLKLSNNVNADMIGIGKGTGVSRTTEEKRIIKPEEFAFMQDIVCVFPTGYQRITKAPYYKDKKFKDRVSPSATDRSFETLKQTL